MTFCISQDIFLISEKSPFGRNLADTLLTKVLGGLCMLLVQIPMLSRFTTLSQARHFQVP